MIKINLEENTLLRLNGQQIWFPAGENEVTPEEAKALGFKASKGKAKQAEKTESE